VKRLLLLLLSTSLIGADTFFIVPKKKNRTSVAKLKEDIGSSYGSIIKRTSQINSLVVDLLEPLIDGSPVPQQCLKEHKQALAEFEVALQKFETGLYEYRDQFKQEKKELGEAQKECILEK
jgi:hypothetical protein